MNQYDTAAGEEIFAALLTLRIPRKARLEFTLESVVYGRMSSSLLQQALVELLAKQPQTLEERAAVDAAIAAVARLLQGVQVLTPLEQPSITAVKVDTPSPKRALQVNSPFFGLGLREAGPKQLALANKPQTSREIWAVLDGAGYQSAHGDPVHAVHDAMRRRARTHGDILLVGEGKWGRKEWYSEEQLEEIRKSIGGMGGRDRSKHSEATKTRTYVARAPSVKGG